MSKKFIVNIFCLSLLIIFVVFPSCQKVFTTSFFTFMQPDAADIPEDQLASYAESVLANGTNEEIAEAYAALQAAIEGGNTDPELNYMAATLALNQAGFSIENIMASMDNAENAVDIFSPASIEFITEAGPYLATASTGVELTATDNVIAGMGLLLTATDGNTEAMIQIMADPDAWTGNQEVQTALDFLNAGGPDFLLMLGFGL